MSSKSNPISGFEAMKFTKTLVANKHGRYHARLGMKRSVRYYAVFKVKDAHSGTIEGHVCDRGGYDIRFVCRPGGLIHGFHSISITPGEEGWGGAFSPENSVGVVEKLLWRAIENTKKTGPVFSNKNMDGFYLTNTRNNEPVTAKGELCLQKAATTKFITENFKKTCLDWRISMQERIPA
ncbi:MAG: hypothetical protein AB7T49_00255 [Oligoflexales bacterium]